MGKALAVLMTTVFLFFIVTFLPFPVQAQNNGNFSIGADGSINPPNAPLTRSGNVYFLTRDVKGEIVVNSSNIVLDGASYNLTPTPIFGYGITLNAVSNVTVTNFIIKGGAIVINVEGNSNFITNNSIYGTDNWVYSISGNPTAAIAVMDSSFNLILKNNLENCTVGINLISWHSKLCANNQIVENNFTDCSNAIAVYDSSNNTIKYNNFFNNKRILHDTGYFGYSLPSFNIWDDGKFGNYWSDYQLRYPYATEINNTGVWDTPYFAEPGNYVDISEIERQEARDYWRKVNAQYQKNTDHYPLMKPFSAKQPVETIPSPSPTALEFSWFPDMILSLSLVLFLSLVIGSILLYRRHRKTANLKQ